MKTGLILSITEPDKLKFILNNLIKVNDIMKKTSIEVDDDAEENEEELDEGMTVKVMKANFVLIDFSFNAIQFKPSAVPRRIQVYDNIFNKKEEVLIEELTESVGDLGMYVDDCKVLYEFLRDNKNLVSSFDIYDNRVEICTKSDKKYVSPRRDNWDSFLPEDIVEINEDEEAFILSLEDNPEKIEAFIKTKGVFTVFFDGDNEEVIIDEKDIDKVEELYDNEYVYHIIISSKYFTGTSGMKSDKSNITFTLQELANNSDALYLTIEFDVNGKKKVSNEYIISVV